MALIAFLCWCALKQSINVHSGGSSLAYGDVSYCKYWCTIIVSFLSADHCEQYVKHYETLFSETASS